jgi:hypothetical protein
VTAIAVRKNEFFFEYLLMFREPLKFRIAEFTLIPVYLLRQPQKVSKKSDALHK